MKYHTHANAMREPVKASVAGPHAMESQRVGGGVDPGRRDSSSGMRSISTSLRRKLTLAALASVGMFVFGFLTIEIFLYLDYRTGTAVSSTMAIALVFALVFGACILTFFTGRRVASGTVGVFVGLLMLFVMRTLPFPWSVLPGASVLIGGITTLMIVGSENPSR